MKIKTSKQSKTTQISTRSSTIRPETLQYVSGLIRPAQTQACPNEAQANPSLHRPHNIEAHDMALCSFRLFYVCYIYFMLAKVSQQLSQWVPLPSPRESRRPAQVGDGCYLMVIRGLAGHLYPFLRGYDHPWSRNCLFVHPS